MLILTRMEHSSTTSPVIETLDYDHQHEDKSTDQVWDIVDDVCGIESWNTMNWVQFDIDASHVQVWECPGHPYL